MTRLQLQLLGPFTASLYGQTVSDFESRRVKLLLAYLATEADIPHGRESLAESLWPNHPARESLGNLRHALANLRDAIDDHSAFPPHLLITSQTLQFNAGSDAVVDVLEFIRVSTSCADLDDETTCRYALSLYRGPFLHEFALDGIPAMEEWILLTREGVRRHMMRCLAYMVGHCVQRSDYLDAVEWTRRQISLEPWNEDAHCQLMWLLALTGARTAALHEYDICRLMLAYHLDLEPQAETVSLVEQIRSGVVDFSLGERFKDKTLFW